MKRATTYATCDLLPVCDHNSQLEDIVRENTAAIASRVAIGPQVRRPTIGIFYKRSTLSALTRIAFGPRGAFGLC
jgi:hypothetical protein